VLFRTKSSTALERLQTRVRRNLRVGHNQANHWLWLLFRGTIRFQEYAVNSVPKADAIAQPDAVPQPSTIMALAPTLPASLAVLAATGAFAGDLGAALWTLLCAWLLVDPLLGSLVASLSWLRIERAAWVEKYEGTRWQRALTPVVLATLMLVLATYYGRWPLMICADALLLALLLVWLVPAGTRRLAIEALQVTFGWTLVAMLQGRLDLESGLAGACLGLILGLSTSHCLVGQVVAGLAWLALIAGAVWARQPLVAGLLAMTAIPAVLAVVGSAKRTAQRWPQLLAIALTALAFWART